jgi:hypothetical protein
MLMSCFGVAVCVFTVFLSGRGVPFSFLVLTVVVVMSCLEVMMSSSLMVRSRIVMMFA